MTKTEKGEWKSWCLWTQTRQKSAHEDWERIKNNQLTHQDIMLAVNVSANHSWRVPKRDISHLSHQEVQGEGGAIISLEANKAAKQATWVQVTPLDIFKDISICICRKQNQLPFTRSQTISVQPKQGVYRVYLP